MDYSLRRPPTAPRSPPRSPPWRAGEAPSGSEVTLGSNVFNLAGLLGLSALIAGRIRFHRLTVVLEGLVGLWIALVGLAVVGGLLAPLSGLLLTLVVFAPYAAYSAEHAAVRARLHLPGRWSAWLARVLVEEETELAVAIRPRPGDRRDAGEAVAALLVVVAASVAMEDAATRLGTDVGVPAIVVGGLVLAAVTSLPNAVAAVYLPTRGRGAATLSEAFSGNAFNVVVVLLVPGAMLGLPRPSGLALLVAGSYLGLTAACVALAIKGRGLSRRAGSLVVAGYALFALALVTR